MSVKELPGVLQLPSSKELPGGKNFNPLIIIIPLVIVAIITTLIIVTRKKKGCNSDRDCTTTQFCDKRKCTSYKKCTSNSDCASGQICVGGTCAPIKTCTTSGNCAADENCISGICAPAKSCGSTLGCSAGEECIQGKCKYISPCTTDQDCLGSTTKCLDGKCVSSCLNVTCPPDNVCINGACVKPSDRVFSNQELKVGNYLVSENKTFFSTVLRTGQYCVYKGSVSDRDSATKRFCFPDQPVAKELESNDYVVRLVSKRFCIFRGQTEIKCYPYTASGESSVSVAILMNDGKTMLYNTDKYTPPDGTPGRAID